MANSGIIFSLALFSHICQWIFLDKVERPHMKKLYGHRIRNRSGLTKAIRDILEEEIDNQRFEQVKKTAKETANKVKSLVLEQLEAMDSKDTRGIC